MLLSHSLQILKQRKRKGNIRVTEQQYDEILKQPIGTGVFVYRNAENEISQLQAKRTEVEVYRKVTRNKTRKNYEAPMQSNYSLLKASVIIVFGLFLLLLGAR